MRVALALALVLLATSASAQSLPFVADFSTSPGAGFDNVIGGSELGVSISKTHLPAGGPAGDGAFRFTWIYDAAQQNATPDYWGGEFYYGWTETGRTAPSNGDNRYARFHFRVLSGSNCLAINSLDGGQPEPMRTKILIVGDGGDGRTIASIECTNGVGTYDLYLQNDGGTVGIESGLAFDTWYSVQVRTLISSVGSGSMSMWLNNDTFGSPDQTQGSLTTGTTTYDTVGLGYYSNRNVTSSGTFSMEFAKLEYADTFDASWFANAASGGGGGSPSGPTRLRIRGEN